MKNLETFIKNIICENYISESLNKETVSIIKDFENRTKEVINERRKVGDILKEIAEEFSKSRFSIKSSVTGDKVDTHINCQITDIYRTVTDEWTICVDTTPVDMRGKNNLNNITGDMIRIYLEEIPVIKKYCEFVIDDTQNHNNITKHIKLILEQF